MLYPTRFFWHEDELPFIEGAVYVRPQGPGVADAVDDRIPRKRLAMVIVPCHRLRTTLLCFEDIDVQSPRSL
jgi:hypothetical protein